MTPGQIRLSDPAPPGSGHRFAALAALAESYLAASLPRWRAVLPPGPFQGEDVHDRQHVTADGRTTTNGVLWLERAGLSVSFDPGAEDGALLATAAADPADGRDDEAAGLRGAVRWHGRTGFTVAFDRPTAAAADFLLDPYGRPAFQADRGVAALLRVAPPAAPQPAPESPADGPRVAVVADPQRMRQVYPAVLAALGDAADALACRPVIDILVPSQTGQKPDDPDSWRHYHAIVLPGGADMERTEALVAVSEAGRRAAIPTLGLCLGMQAICLAAARRLPDLQGATLAEIAPDAEQQLFTPLPADNGRPAARLGDRAVSLPDDSHLARQLRRFHAATAWPERMNHRYRLAPRYLHRLPAGGLQPLSQDSDCLVVDIVEDPSLPCYVGSEGHPELTSRRGRPHPLFRLLLATALQAAAPREART